MSQWTLYTFQWIDDKSQFILYKSYRIEYEYLTNHNRYQFGISLITSNASYIYANALAFLSRSKIIWHNSLFNNRSKELDCFCKSKIL